MSPVEPTGLRAESIARAAGKYAETYKHTVGFSLFVDLLTVRKE